MSLAGRNEPGRHPVLLTLKLQVVKVSLAGRYEPGRHLVLLECLAQP